MVGTDVGLNGARIKKKTLVALANQIIYEINLFHRQEQDSQIITKLLTVSSSHAYKYMFRHHNQLSMAAWHLA